MLMLNSRTLSKQSVTPSSLAFISCYRLRHTEYSYAVNNRVYAHPSTGHLLIHAVISVNTTPHDTIKQSKQSKQSRRSTARELVSNLSFARETTNSVKKGPESMELTSAPMRIPQT